jgi:hypothetical protein
MLESNNNDELNRSEENRSDLISPSITAISTSNDKLEDAVVVARRAHPNWIEKRSKFLRLSKLL